MQNLTNSMFTQLNLRPTHPNAPPNHQNAPPNHPNAPPNHQNAPPNYQNAPLNHQNVSLFCQDGMLLNQNSMLPNTMLSPYQQQENFDINQGNLLQNLNQENHSSSSSFSNKNQKIPPLYKKMVEVIKLLNSDQKGDRKKLVKMLKDIHKPQESNEESSEVFMNQCEIILSEIMKNSTKIKEIEDKVIYEEIIIPLSVSLNKILMFKAISSIKIENRKNQKEFKFFKCNLCFCGQILAVEGSFSNHLRKQHNIKSTEIGRFKWLYKSYVPYKSGRRQKKNLNKYIKQFEKYIIKSDPEEKHIQNYQYDIEYAKNRFQELTNQVQPQQQKNFPNNVNGLQQQFSLESAIYYNFQQLGNSQQLLSQNYSLQSHNNQVLNQSQHLNQWQFAESQQQKYSSYDQNGQSQQGIDEYDQEIFQNQNNYQYPFYSYSKNEQLKFSNTLDQQVHEDHQLSNYQDNQI